MNRLELRQLAEDRIADAALLLASGRWSGTYYLAGYAVECGLKACIARLTNQDDFPRDRKFVEECCTHNLEKVLKAAASSRRLMRTPWRTPPSRAIGALRKNGMKRAGTSRKRRPKLKSSTTRSRITRMECCRGYANAGK